MSRAADTVTQLVAEAQVAYQRGDASRSLSLWENLLERENLDRTTALKARFWIVTILHGLGRYEAACRIGEPLCFDPTALGRSPLWVYRIATRVALLYIELGRPLDETEALLARIAELVSSAKDSGRSRYWLVRARLEAARGRRAAALQSIERGLRGRHRCTHPFAATPYFRAMLPLLLEKERLDEARKALQRWQRSGDPDAFQLPHIPALRADWHRAAGSAETALRHAMFAFEQARSRDDVAGRLNAAHALCRAALVRGDAGRARTGLRALLRERRQTTPEERLRIDLTAADVHLGLACLRAGLPVPDLEYGGEFAVESRAAEAVGAERALGDATRACTRAARGARELDAVFGTRFRTSASRRRLRFLGRLRRRIPRASASTVPPGKRPVPEKRRESTAQQKIDSPPLAPCSDGFESWLVAPAADLAGLAEELVESGRRTFVAYPADREPADRECGFGFDLWLEGELAGSGCASIVSRDRDEEPLLVIETDEAPLPDWLGELALLAKRHEARQCLGRAEIALAAGDADAAAGDLRSAVSLQPLWGSAWERRAHCQLEQGRARDALQTSLRALEIDSTGAQPWLTVARVFEALGRPSDARAAMEQAGGRRGDDDQSSPQEELPFSDADAR